MELNKVVELKLLKHNLITVDDSDDYSFAFIDISNYKQHITDLLYVSSLMKKDFDWGGIPDESSLIGRFESKSFCLLSYYKSKIIGWIWANNNYTPYWEDSVQKLNSNEIYVGGSYLSKTVERPSGSGLYFYSKWFEYFLTEMGNKVAYSYVDIWNTRSLELAFKIGMKEYNFIK